MFGPVIPIAPLQIGAVLAMAVGLLTSVYILFWPALAAQRLFPPWTRREARPLLIGTVLVAALVGFGGFRLWLVLDDQEGEPRSRFLPGESGWVFVGSVQGDTYLEGPWASTDGKPAGRFEKGDVITLRVRSDVNLVDFQLTGVAKLSQPPPASGVEAKDKTGISLPAGTRLVVHEVREVLVDDGETVAVWLQVALP